MRLDAVRRACAWGPMPQSLREPSEPPDTQEQEQEFMIKQYTAKLGNEEIIVEAGRLAGQAGGAVGEGLVGLEGRHGLDAPLRAGAHLVHVTLQILKFMTGAAARQAGEQGERRHGAKAAHGVTPLSL